MHSSKYKGVVMKSQSLILKLKQGIKEIFTKETIKLKCNLTLVKPKLELIKAYPKRNKFPSPQPSQKRAKSGL